jgi:site-specific recombinase XerD
VSAPNDGGRRWPSSLSGDDAGPPRRAIAQEQGHAIPGRPTTIDEIVAVMRQAGDSRHGCRLRALIVVLWRAGVRIQERSHSQRQISMSAAGRRWSGTARTTRDARSADASAWSVLAPWIAERIELPVGALFCVIDGPTRGRAWSPSAVRLELRRTARDVGVRRRFAPHQLRHTHAVELLHEGIGLPLIQRQLGHAYLSTTGTYLQGISSKEIIAAIHARHAQMGAVTRMT